jgi:hypothetical protein
MEDLHREIYAKNVDATDKESKNIKKQISAQSGEKLLKLLKTPLLFRLHLGKFFIKLPLFL